LIVKQVRLNNFRNYNDYELNLDSQKPFNFLIGANGTGKTNFIESLYYSSYLRSFRTRNETDMIQRGQQNFFISIDYSNNNLNNDIKIEYSKKKNIYLNSKKIHKYSDILGEFLTVLYSSTDINIIYGSPVFKRNFFDIIICLTDNQYLNSLRDYNQIIKKKNILLKQKDSDSLVDVYDIQISELMEIIIKKRTEFIFNFDKLFQEKYSISGQYNFKTKVIYIPSIKLKENNSHRIYDFLYSKRNEFYNNGTSLYGIHRDSYMFLINGVGFEKFGSLGQCRLASLVIKMVQTDIYKKRLNINPVVLLDDVILELDSFRKKQVLKELFYDSQVFATFTGEHYENYIEEKTKINKIFME